MTMTQMPRNQGTPGCFGKEWDKNESECAGGLDAKYTNIRTGTHVRDKCEFFESCGARVQAQRQASCTPYTPQQPVAQQQQQQQQPMAAATTITENLLRQFTAHALPTTPTPQPQSIQVRQTAVQPQYYQQQQPAAPQQYMQQQLQVAAPAYQLNYMVPAYLSAPEVRQPGESIWKPLLFELLRAFGKSTGHTAAHFFDRTVVRQPPQG